MARRRRRNPWVSVGEVLTWVLFVALLFPAGFAGWAVGHYTSLGGKSGGTHTVTVTAGATTSGATPTTAPTTTASGGSSTTSTTGSGGASTTGGGSGTTANAAGDASAGKAVFESSGCGSCHTYGPAGSKGAVGPDLDTRPKQDAGRANMQLTDFIRQSIVDPNAYVAPGYPKGVMPQNYAQQLSKTQLTDLVAFLSSRS